MLPYLACYMGHADLRGTQYYLPLRADAEAWFASDPLKFAQWSADEVVDLMRDIAFTLGASAPPLDELEVEAQRELLAELERAPLDGMLAVLRRASEALIAASSRPAAIDYARTRGWIS